MRYMLTFRSKFIKNAAINIGSVRPQKWSKVGHEAAGFYIVEGAQGAPSILIFFENTPH